MLAKAAHLWLVTSALLRFLSYLWPIRVLRTAGKHGSLELTWEQGGLVVNSSNANQSHGSLHRVWLTALREEGPVTAARVLVLGWGAGSAERILRFELKWDPLIVGVDDDEVIVNLGREHFHTGVHHRTTVHVADAFEFIHGHSTTYDLILVDLFHDLTAHPSVAEVSFLTALKRLVSKEGLVMVNLVEHDQATHDLSTRFITHARQVFGEVRERRYEGNNRVFIAL